MRIKEIQLAWFRGAADPVSLELDSRSTVVYGVNGSGKSSFVDAVEHILKGGRIGHLAHEYSGRRQEKAIPNTHKPRDRKTEFKIKFQDDSELKAEISQDGISTTSGAETIAMHTWDYRSTVLRQDEVSEFIHETKGRKYSALLPLLGLHQMELAAENLRQLVKSVQEKSNFDATRATLRDVAMKRQATFGTDSTDRILMKIESLHRKYCPEKDTIMDTSFRCADLQTALEARLSASSDELRQYVALQDVARLELKGSVDTVRATTEKLTHVVEPLIIQKLEVLQSTSTFVAGLGEQEEVECPACGRFIGIDSFKEHIKAERERLHEIIENFNTRKAAIGTLCNTVNLLKSILSKDDVKSWRKKSAEDSLSDNFRHLDGINTETLRNSCNAMDIKAIENKLLPLIETAAAASKDAPPDAQHLSTDKQIVEVGKAVISSIELARGAERAEALISFIESLERGIREEIKLQSQAIIEGISADIRTMWAILYPGEPIEDIRFYIPKDVDKAIDIGLKFYGIEQDSPRLTLSEGYRNGLGLCIFLAMAKREVEKDRPLFLDDVVVSLDRNHRGMIAELLEKEFNGRQLVILTHDREWYTELRQQLDSRLWTFKALLPYETPDLGIRWSHRTTTFDDARAQLKERPDSAGNDARKIMDVELAIIAERLQIRMPYLRAEKNDRRLAHDLLIHLIAAGKKCFEIKQGDSYKTYAPAIESFEQADRLLVSWADRASHSFDLVRLEATRLIDSCERALEFFKCSSCNKLVCFAEAERSEWVQCKCSRIRWRYGKL